MLSFCHVSDTVRASGSCALTTERNDSQYPFGNEASPETSIRQPLAPALSHCFVMLSPLVRKYACTSGCDFCRTGMLSNPNHAS